MSLLILTAIALAFVFLVIFGALSDLSTFRIPNWVSYWLVILFVAQSIFLWGSTPDVLIFSVMVPAFVVNLAVGLVVFIVSLVFWGRGYIGGGDAKYLVATSLWMGPVGVVEFMVLVSALSVVMALLLKVSANWGFLIHEGRFPGFVRRLYAKFEDNKLPFGFPIGLAALIMMPQVFTA
ncbi:prepilin peptidase [Aestuariivirga sp.]|uniref:A24 family peptidase n=1 Tax=Aestuariivirga sp. TaxID=2650926 RepID=UPI00301AD2B7